MNLRCTILTLVAVLAAVPAAAATQAESIPIDRWLLADAFGPEPAGDSQLEVELLDPPGESGVLPDRGLPASGAVWHLHRLDGESDVSLDSLLADVSSGTVVYAHVYARLPLDRTIRFIWETDGCTVGRAWLNGRPIEAHDVVARFGAGWNTILLKLEAGDCAFGYSAMLASEQAIDLEDIQLQASRPPGEVRTGPEAWVIPYVGAEVSPDRRWSGDRLFAGLVIGLTGWGRSPISNVEVDLQGVADGKTEAPWLTPGEPTEVVVPVRLDRLQRALDAGFVVSKISWEDTKIEHQLTVSSIMPEVSDTIMLDGWKISRDSDEGRGQRVEGQIPNAAGWLLEGEWKVPEILAGQDLFLQVEGSSADYVLNGTALNPTDDEMILCASCSKGTKLSLIVRTTGSWDAMPIIRVSRSAD